MKSKWIIVVLVLSLALNLAFVGFWAGRSGKLYAMPDPTRGYPRWAMSLPDERREALRPTLFNAEKRRHLRALREHHQALHRAVSAEPFKPEALTSALADMRSGLAALESANHASFQEFVSHLTAAERQALAAHLERPHKRGRPPPPGPRRED